MKVNTKEKLKSTYNVYVLYFFPSLYSRIKSQSYLWLLLIVFFLIYNNFEFRYQKTSEVVSGTADAVRGVFAPAINDIRNTSFFKSFETKIGTAYTSVSVINLIKFLKRSRFVILVNF